MTKSHERKAQQLQAKMQALDSSLILFDATPTACQFMHSEIDRVIDELGITDGRKEGYLDVSLSVKLQELSEITDLLGESGLTLIDKAIDRITRKLKIGAL